MLRKITFSSLLILVTGCSAYSLQELRKTTPKGSEFQKELSRFYMKLAESEEKDYDWRDSWYFADKGLVAAYGHDVNPEELKNWDIAEDKLPQLKAARDDLIFALKSDIILKKPKLTAKAQYYFDCWVEQQEENWQQEEIDYCRNGFNETMAELVLTKIDSKRKNIKTLKKSSGKSLVNKVRKPPEEKSTVIYSYLVLFKDGGIELTSMGSSALEEIINILKDKKNYEIIISDKSGVVKNDLLSERVQYIKEFLIASSIEGGSIKTSVTVNSSGSRAVKAKFRVEIFINE
ncbi:MAG: hypothetical protein R3D71_00700 [Rickettsiales bacterium]